MLSMVAPFLHVSFLRFVRLVVNSTQGQNARNRDLDFKTNRSNCVLVGHVDAISPTNIVRISANLGKLLIDSEDQSCIGLNLTLWIDPVVIPQA